MPVATGSRAAAQPGAGAGSRTVPQSRTVTQPGAGTGQIPAHLGRLLVLLATAVAAVLLTLAPAYAEEPFNLPDEVVDQSGVLQDESSVRSALDRLHDESGLQLFVVFVDDFAGLSGADWADRTAGLSHLGDADLLVAVATDERSWGMSVSPDSGISADQQDRVSAEFVEPRLREGAWDEAAVAAADGFLMMSQEESTAGRNLLLVSGGAAALGAAGWGGRALRRRNKERRSAQERAAERAAVSEAVGSSLVALDDRLTAAEHEVQYAEAEFAPQFTQPFRESVEQSRADAIEAYRLRTQIGDVDVVRDHGGTLDQFERLRARIDGATTRLEEQTRHFNELRQLADRAPQRIDELSSDLVAATRTVDDLEPLISTRTDLRAGQREQFTDVLASCRTLLAQTGASLEVARERLVDSGGEGAVLPLRTAEQALAEVAAQTEPLADLDAVVAGWSALLEQARASLAADVADAERLVPEWEGVGAQVGAARELLALTDDPAQDPVDLAEALGEAERALDASLDPLREAEERHLKAVARAEAQLGRGRSRVNAMESRLRSERSLADEHARRNAQEARDLLAEGERLIPSDPEIAEATLRRTVSLAAGVINSLLPAAEPAEHGGGWLGGSSGSSSRRRSRSRSQSSSRRRSRSSSRRSSGRSRSRRRSSGGRF